MAASDAPLFSSREDLEVVAKRLRRRIVTMIARAGSGHPGGSLSAVEIVTALYWKVLRHKPADPLWPDRDRLILSKGHAAPLLYTALAECGYIPIEELDTLRRFGSRLQGHTDRTCVPGIEMSAGSLGQGLSFATGVAIAGKLDNKNYRVYALLSDGENDEGQTWEAAMAAAHYKLDNLTVIVDNNGMQLSGCSNNIMTLEPLADKWAAFGWDIIEVNGHDVYKLLWAFEEAKKTKGMPAAIIAHTVKGKGVSFMENNVDFHGKAPTPQQLEIALKELA
ncbi:MAG: transketolase [Chloroflexi bacterium RBG_16_58_8]|nr:MAG: transketolase [Chloroflexi bacterium RBG_16_58_8]